MKSPAAIVGSEAGRSIQMQPVDARMGMSRTELHRACLLKSNAGPNTEPEESENELRKTDELRDRLATPN